MWPDIIRRKVETYLDMETICDIFIDAIKLAGELLKQVTSLDTITHRCNILLGIFDEFITDFQLPPTFKYDLEQLIGRLITWKGHASMHLKSNSEDKRKRYTGKPGWSSYDIPLEQIERLLYGFMGFFWVKIADFLPASERTLRNKRAELDISLKYFQINEMQLDAKVQTILRIQRRC